MRYGMMALIVFCVLALAAGESSAQKGLVETVADGCKKELETYCKDVTQGDGRILACLYAYSDKLSAQCEYALYDVAAQLERAVAQLTYLVNECREDFKTYCAHIKPGEGRLLACIKKQEDKISSRCKQALKKVGAK
jgi:hypothetical protein